MAPAQSLIDLARLRHAAFLDLAMPEGGLLLHLNTQQRTLLLRYASQVESLLSESVTLATVLGGTLVGFEEDPDTGVRTPYYLTTLEDGYAVQNDGGVPFVDFSTDPIAQDPFGATGGTPGFALPPAFVKLIIATVTHADGRTGRLDLVTEQSRVSAPGRNPQAFINGNRLIPVRGGDRPARTASDIWTTITDVSLSYIALPALTALTDELVCPVVLHGALVAGLAELLAMNARSLSIAERQYFSKLAREAEAGLEEAGEQITRAATVRSVVYRA